MLLIQNIQLFVQKVEVTKAKKFSPSVFYHTQKKEYLNDTLNRKTIIKLVFCSSLLIFLFFLSLFFSFLFFKIIFESISCLADVCRNLDFVEDVKIIFCAWAG